MFASSQSLPLRLATEDDLDRIMELETLGFAPAICESRDVMQQRLQCFREGFLVLEAPDGKVVGYLCSELWKQDGAGDPAHFALGHAIWHTHDRHGTHLYISSMTIDPAHRGGGLGGRFFRQCLTRLRAHQPQLQSSILLLSAEWQIAHRIYRDYGYRERQRLPHFFDAIATHDGDAIVMQMPFA